jgi:bifunctional UDP-N-acetylglucosamine pyrophosphorylase/glucosamine-1-phosphate N-acetyltransferase
VRKKIQAAVVLAAGSGSRFWPYNVVRNKVAFPVCNVPVVRRLVDDLVQLGVSNVVVVVGQGEASVRAALRGTAGQLAYVRQSKPEGTAAAAWLGVKALDEDALADGVLIVHGDLSTDRKNLEVLLEGFAARQPPAAALVQPLGEENPRDWIVAHTDGEVLRGVEGHARGGQHRLCGVYAFLPDALEVLRDNPGLMRCVPVGGMPPLEAEIAQSLQTLIDEGEESVLAVEAPGYHTDLDKPWHILEANHRVMDGMSAALAESVLPAFARVHDGAEIGGRLVLGENAVIGNRAVIQGDLWLGAGARIENGAIVAGPAVVGPGTVLRDYCQIGGHSTLGPRGVYGHGAEYGGVALDTVYCYHYCEIWGVTGSAVDFGAATVCGNLRFDDGETVWRVKGRPEVPTFASNAAYLGDYCRTGVNAILMPGRRVGAYACVGPGVVLCEDVPDRTMVLVKQELETRPWGPERYGW